MKKKRIKAFLFLFLIVCVSSCSFVAQKWKEFGITKSFGGNSLEPVYFKSARIQTELERMRKKEEVEQMINLLPSVLPERKNE